MYKSNCWEFKNCGRQPGGGNVNEFGVCRAAVESSTHGINNGINGGRACWVIPETLCGDEKQGGYLRKLHQCISCDFYALVREEEGRSYKGSKTILKIIKLQSSADISSRPGPAEQGKTAGC